MATVEQVIGMLKDFAPEEHAFKEEYDNVGLLFGDKTAPVTKLVVALDATEAVIDEAVTLGAELIVSHHPFIYCPVKRINAEDIIGRKILKAAKAGINIYSAHTNLDFVKDGINDFLAVSLNLREIKPLTPYISEQAGFGRVGELQSKVFCSVLKGEVEMLLSDMHVRVIGDLTAQVKRVAIINGGGGGDTKYIDMALSAGADCLITADVKHHVAVYAREAGLTVIEPQHFNMEYAYLSRLCRILKIEAKSRKTKIEILQSQAETNPRI
ncbi:MAG: Nif3-like dinuclear metal center hexameric protein [Firmicutes bacterium]|nr:Nif3-like dinuclear metal center hexameric protein [Bacillota bacterium]